MRSMQDRTLPNLLVIGAQKCGTTSLHAYLGAHPEIFMAPGKELDFFIAAGEAHAAVRANWERGLDWYRSQFGNAAAAVRGESSPNYTFHPVARGVPERAASVVPHAKLVYLVRDPVERVASGYMEEVVAGRERRSIDETLARIGAGTPTGHLYRSMYFMQLRQWLDWFPKDALLVMAQEDLLADRRRTLSEVLSFLGVDPSAAAPEIDRLRNVSTGRRAPGAIEQSVLKGRLAATARRTPGVVRRPLRRAVRSISGRRIERPRMSEATEEAVRTALADDVAALRRLTGRSFPHWSV